MKSKKDVARKHYISFDKLRARLITKGYSKELRYSIGEYYSPLWMQSIIFAKKDDINDRYVVVVFCEKGKEPLVPTDHVASINYSKNGFPKRVNVDLRKKEWKELTEPYGKLYK